MIRQLEANMRWLGLEADDPQLHREVAMVENGITSALIRLINHKELGIMINL